MSSPSSLPLLLFDVDGTLTVPRLSMTPEMRVFMEDVRAKGVPLAVVGGSDLSKVVEQLGNSLDDVTSRFDYVFTENGLVGFKGKDALPVGSIQDELGEDKLQKLINHVLDHFSKLELPRKRGNFVEFRKGMLNLCPIGRSCSYEERLEFNAYDNEHGVRQKLVDELMSEFGHYNIEVAIGGQISVDVYPKGWDKTYCLRYLTDNYPTIHFFGDKTSKGGNDYAIYEDSRTIGHSVKSPEDTKEQVESLLKQIGVL